MSELQITAAEQARQDTHLADARADVMQQARRLIRSYVAAEEMPTVYAAYGEQPYDGDDLEGALAHAEAFGNRNLDVRHGKPRSRSVPKLPEAQATALVRLGEEVGMLGAQSMLGANVNTVLIHGTYYDGMYNRVQVAKQHLDWQKRTYNYYPHRILALATNRQLNTEDFRTQTGFFPYPLAQTEHQVMNGIINSVFKPWRHDSWERDGGKITSFTLNHDTSILSLSAPAGEGRTLPNTADTQRYAALITTEPSRFSRVLATTTSVYSGFQQLDLLRTWGLPFGASINMASYHDPSWTQPAHIGQEVNSVFDQGALMLEAIKAYEAQQPLTETATIDLGK